MADSSFRTLSLVLILPILAAGGRLPYSGVRPLAYDIYLRPGTVDLCRFQGKVKINLSVENSTEEILLHSRHLIIDESSVTLDDVPAHDQLQTNNVDEDGTDSENEVYIPQNISVSYGEGEAKHILRISLANPLQPGSLKVLSISYNGTMNAGKTSGIYCRKYKHNNETRWFVSSTFEPYLARSAFPCFDEPSYKANFTLHLAHPKEYSAISNMPSASIKKLEGEEGWLVTDFLPSPPMSTYLVGFLVSRFESRELSLADDHLLRVWASSGEKLETGDLALAFARRHYTFLANYTSLPDPLPKTDLLAIRHYLAGGLENWGIISLEERLVLLDSKTRSRKSNLLRASSLIAHELAHIWFGNLVTPEYWDDIWLSEGFASYFASLATHKMYPKYGYDVQSWVLSRLAAMSADSLPTTHPLKVPLSQHPTGDLFDEITYHKGHYINEYMDEGKLVFSYYMCYRESRFSRKSRLCLGELMVRMLALTLGEDCLQRALRAYLKERQFRSASDTRLWQLIEREAQPGLLPENVTLAEIMETWTSLPGFPVVTVRRNYQTGEVTISQRSVLETEGEAGGWWIPLAFTSSRQLNFSASPRLWLAPYTGPITINVSATKDDWLIFNTKGAGYYTVRYDDRNSLLLADELDSLPLTERIQVLGDILELGRLGQSPVELSLDVILHFHNEPSPFPWFLFLASAPKYMSLFKATPLEPQFKNMVKGVLEPEMQKLGKDSPHRKQVMKLSCKVGVKNCTDMAIALFQEWKHNSTQLPEEVEYTVFCTAVAQGNKTTWDYMMERYHTSENRKEKKDILKALACTTDNELNKRYVAWALERNNKTKDDCKKTGTVLKALAENDPSLVLSTLSKQKTAPSKLGRNMKWKKVLENVALHVNNEQQLKQLKRLVDEEKGKWKSAEGRGSRGRVLGIAEANVSWLRDNQGRAQRWLHDNLSKLHSSKHI